MNKGNMKPPFSYYGGKQRMAHNIIPLIPKHTVYVEPFCGSATIMFKKPWPDVTNSHNYREVINDTNGDVVNFFKQLRDNGEELVKMISFSLYSHKTYAKSKKNEAESDTERAFDFFINMNMCFGGVPHGGWGCTVSGGNRPYTFMNKVNNLSEYVSRIRGCYIENVSAIECIKKWDSPQTFFYCDPPYIGTDCGDYKGFSTEDFASLVSALKNVEGQFLLSGYDNHDVEIPFPSVEFSAINSSAKNKRTSRTECVWYKYNDVFPEKIQKFFRQRQIRLLYRW